MHECGQCADTGITRESVISRFAGKKVANLLAELYRIFAHCRHVVGCPRDGSLMRFESGEMYLQCQYCMLRSPGWVVIPAPMRESLLE